MALPHGSPGGIGSPGLGNLRGMGLMLVATLVIVVQHVMVKHLAQDMHSFEIAFFRTIFGLVALSPWFLRYGIGILRTQKLGLHAVRAGLQTLSALCFFFALGVAPLAQVTALQFASPLFATLLAVLFLGERISYRRWSAILFGFAGTYVIVRPEAGLDPGAVAVLVSAAAWALTMIVIKMLGRTESSITTTMYMYVLMTPLTLIAALPNWTWPSLVQYGWLFLIGLTGSYAHVLMAQALKEGDTNVVTPVEFVKLVWATLFGYLLFGELADLYVYVGAAMIFASGTYIAYRENQLRRERNAR